MLHKYAELDIYEDFINGNLNPVKIQGEYLTTISKYLDEQVNNCQDMILGKFKSSRKKHQLIEKVKISIAHPLAPEYFYQNQLFIDSGQEVLSKDILQKLEIDSRTDHEMLMIKKQDQHDLVGVTFASEWDEMQTDRLKYCYINQILEETVSKTKSNLRADIFSEKAGKARSIIHSVQRLLISYLNDILQQFDLKECDLKIKVKPSYSNKDCAALIYLSIVDIMNFIYRHFHEFLDHKEKVPFFSSIANQNEFVGSARKILKLLKKIQIDDALYSFIQDKLEKVLNMNINTRITYKEVSYFSGFINTFLRFLEKNKFYNISDDELIHFLISYNFNDFIFYEYLIRRIRLELLDCDSAHEMEVVLHRKQTEFKQINPVTQNKLIADRQELLPMLLSWIDIELAYVDKLKKEPQVEMNNVTKLKTNLNASELALLFKVLYDKEHITPETKSEMLKWIQRSFKNEHRESISIQHLRNNMYNHSPKTLEKVKSIGIDLINEVKLI